MRSTPIIDARDPAWPRSPWRDVTGDLPVLGDYDGDGRDDPCVFRAGEILCNTAHDGGAAEARLFFGRNGDRPLFGNLDGL